jgi:uncharacterized protein YndB with AHSA1/START domain
MKRLQIFVFGLVLLAVLFAVWVTKTKPGEILTSYRFVSIDAPVDKVWAALTDISSYPAWNPYVVEASGTLRVGEKLKIIEEIGGRRQSHAVRVTRFDPTNRVLVWQGSTFPSSLLQWSEWFSVEAVDANHSRVTMLITHQGLLAHLYRKFNKNRDLHGFLEFATALKKKAER